MRNSRPILLVEDDDVDAMTTRRALDEVKVTNELIHKVDGEEALEYLMDKSNQEPCVILLDLNMPRKDGREALAEIKADANLRSIPVVILTTSKAEEDILKTYELGVSGYVTKPVTFDRLVEVMKVLGDYWFQIVKLP